MQRCAIVPIDSDANTSGPQGFLFSALKTFYLSAGFDLQPKKSVREVWEGQPCVSYIRFGFCYSWSCSARPRPRRGHF